MTTRNSEKHNVNEILQPERDGRIMVLGRTGSGKSTLLSLLLKAYLYRYSGSRALIIDSKPRFKAEWLTDGTKAARLYKNWSRGEFLPGSFRIRPDKSIKSELDEVWRAKGRIAIAQTTPGSISDLRWLETVATTFYGGYSDKIPRLIVVDELADFFTVQRGGSGIFWQVARSGRELTVSLMAGSQRPSYIPKVVMTEADRLYLFALDYHEDIKTVWAMGVPKEVEPPREKHAFFYWNKEQRFDRPSGQEYILEM